MSAFMWLIGSFLAHGAEPERDVHVLRFESGLRAVVEHRRELARTSTAVLVGVGEQHTARGREHLAHLVEHLWFRAGTGATHRQRLHAWGCSVNAHTWPDRTAYLASCPTDVTPGLLDLTATLVDDPLAGLDVLDVSVERDVLAVEIAQRRAGAAVHDAVVSRIDPDNPEAMRAGREGLGTLTLEHANTFVEAHYHPSNAVVAVVSSVPVSTIRGRLEKHFGPVRSTEAVGTHQQPTPAGRRAMRLDTRHVPAPVERPMVLLTYALPSSTLGDGDVFGTILTAAIVLQVHGIADAQCAPRFTAASRLMTCVVVPEEEVDIDVFALRVREAADIRPFLVTKGLKDWLTQAQAEAQLRSDRAEGILEPVPWNRPATLAQWMFFHDRAPVRGWGQVEITKRVAKQVRDRALRALDPQQALVLALVPSGNDPLELPVPSDLSADPEPLRFAHTDGRVADTAHAWAREGFVAVHRPDMREGFWTGTPSARLWVGPQRGDALADLPRDPDASAWEEEEPPRPGITFTANADAGLASLGWTCSIPKEAGAASRVLAPLLAERAYQRLREQTAWAYSPWVNAVGDRLVFGADVVPAATHRVVRQVHTDLEEIASERLVDGELEVARRRASVSASTALALLSDWPGVAAGPRGARSPDEIRALPIRVIDTTAADLASLARRCVGAAGWEIAGPEAVEAHLLEAGLLPSAALTTE